MVEASCENAPNKPGIRARYTSVDGVGAVLTIDWIVDPPGTKLRASSATGAKKGLGVTLSIAA